jgi:nitrite reductase/ring-hydroxylating ferredoxin subunit
MAIDRREFVRTLGAASLLTAARGGLGAAASAPAPPSGGAENPTVIDAGDLHGFPTDGVYDAHREDGFFVVRRDGQLFALSSVCTHKGCKVRAQADGSYLCKCHNSTFDRDGRVTRGPATRDLPRLAVAVDAAMCLQVDLHQPFEAGHFSPPLDTNAAR